MASLSSSSTRAQIEAAYDDNASYAEDGDASKARAFLTACRLLKRRLIGEMAKGSERIRLDENLRQLDIEMEQARQWLDEQGESSSGTSSEAGHVTHLSMEDFRG